MAVWIDITRILYDGIEGWPGDPPFRLRQVADLARDAARVTEICTSAHIGTHVDAPLHCLAGAADVASLDLGRLCGSAVVVDVSGRAEVSTSDLQHADIQPGDRVLLRTANEKTAEITPLAIDAAAWLVRRGVVLLGIDTASPDRPDAHDLPVHRLLLEAGVPILEGLSLAHVLPGRYEMIALPLPIAGCEASPARVILRRDDLPAGA